MYSVGVIGLGPAGCLFLASLPDTLYRDVVVFDSGGVGGDLGRLWGAVVANLTREELERAFRAVPRWRDVPLSVLETYAPDTCPLLSDVALQLRELMKPVLRQVTLHSQHVRSAHQEVAGWRIVAEGEHRVARLVVCTGGEPRLLDYPKPVIPLAVALDERQLAAYVRASDHVVVFGTAHSGTLILRNLRRIGCELVAVHVGVPFRWVRRHTPECPCVLIGGTGCHDSEGLKQESAAIADLIVRGEWPVRLIRADEGAELVRAVMAADFVVYATGFKARVPTLYGLGGEVLEVRHSPQTGAIAPGCWGFGLAYPSLYEKPQGGQAADIGLPGFVAQIQRCLGQIIG